MGTATKKQHYVPQNYLDAFAENGQLWVFDKTNGASFRSSVRDAGERNRFYDLPELDEVAGVDQALERSFQPLEGAAAAVLRDLLAALEAGSFVAITQAQRIDLSLYLALQLLRTPESRESSKQLSLALHKEAFLAWLHARGEGDLLDEASFELEMTEDEQRRNHARVLLDHDLRERIAEILYRHYWVVLENPCVTAHPFIASDHPACNHGTVSHPVRSMQGLASVGAEILFPLSPRYLLLIVERRAFPHAARLDGRLDILGSAENVEYYNHWQVRHAYRFLYSRTDVFDLARSMTEETPELADVSNARFGTRVFSEVSGSPTG